MSASPKASSAHSSESFRFALPGRLEYRDAARGFLSHICDHLVQEGLVSSDISHRVISAFVEAFNNTVIHAYANALGPIEIELDVTPERLRLSIIDQGAPFTPDAVPEPDLDALPEGGLGLFIIRSFMDTVEYRHVGNRNILTMDKALATTKKSENIQKD